MKTEDHERTAARLQSYTTKAIVVLILYLFFWLPGFIANILFHNEAQRMQRKADESLPGAGCLSVMLWINVALLVIVSISFIISLVA